MVIVLNRLRRDSCFLLSTTGNNSVTYYELPSIYGHDTFLLDVVAVGAAVKVRLRSCLFWCTPRMTGVIFLGKPEEQTQSENRKKKTAKSQNGVRIHHPSCVTGLDGSN